MSARVNYQSRVVSTRVEISDTDCIHYNGYWQVRWHVSAVYTSFILETEAECTGRGRNTSLFFKLYVWLLVFRLLFPFWTSFSSLVSSVWGRPMTFTVQIVMPIEAMWLGLWCYINTIDLLWQKHNRQINRHLGCHRWGWHHVKLEEKRSCVSLSHQGLLVCGLVSVIIVDVDMT